MFKLIRYTLRNEFLKFGTYAIPLFGIMVYSVLTYAQVFGKFAQQEISFIKSGNAFSFITIFTISVVFTAIKVVNIFKQPKDTGLDIIYSSKPISKKEITFSKFISIWVMIIYFSVVFLVATSLIAMMDKNSSSVMIWNYSISIFIGNITILFAISSILIIISTIFSQKALLLFAALISVFVPSFSIILSQTIKPHMPTAHLLPAYLKASNNLEDITQHNARIYATRENTVFINKPSVFVPTFKYKYDAYKKNTLYRTLAYFDPWYQFSSLYDVTYKSQFAQKGKNWVEKTETYKRQPGEYTVEIGSEKYTPLFAKGIIDDRQNSNIAGLMHLKFTDIKTKNNSLKYLSKVRIVSSKFNSWSFLKQIMFVAATMRDSARSDGPALEVFIKDTTNAIDKLTESEANVQLGRGNIQTSNTIKPRVPFSVDAYAMMAWSLMVHNQNVNQYTQLTPANTLGIKNRFGDHYELILVKDGDKIPVIVPMEYINKTNTYGVWAALAFFMVFSSVIIISRKNLH